MSMFVLFLGLAASASAQSLTKIEWQEDLDFLVQSIYTHPDPFYLISEEMFQESVTDLAGAITTLSDHEIIIGMARLTAMLQDGHTAVRGGLDFLTGQFPVRLYVFDDGIHVIGASEQYSNLVGNRVLKVSDTSAEEVYLAVSGATPHDNEMTLKNRVPDSILIPEFLHALDIIPARDKARFTFLNENRQEFTLDIVPLPFDEEITWVNAFDSNEIPLYLQNTNRNYWHDYQEENHLLYVQYNQVRDSAEESIAQYFDRVSQLSLEQPVENIVLDLRFNGGGNDYLNGPVMQWIVSSPLVSQGRFYVIIGRATYSAAQKLVTRLDSTNVILVGEPTGGSPNHFGDAREFILPNSKLSVTVSTVFHNDARGDSRRSIEPDIEAPVLATEYFAGQDSALNKIMSEIEQF